MARSDRYTRKILTSGDRSKWSDLYVSDSNKIILGADGDLQIYHDGNDNHIEATSALNIATANSGVAVKIGHTTSEVSVSDNFTITGNTTANGTVQINNTLTIGVDDTGHDVKFFGATSGRYMQWNESDDKLKISDGAEFCFGDADDLKIYHDGSNSYIKQQNARTGSLYIDQDTNDADIVFRNDDGSGGRTAYITIDGSTGYVKFEDNRRIAVGSGNDFMIYHDGTDTKLSNVTGTLQFHQNVNDSDIMFLCDDGSGGTTTYFALDGSATNMKAYKNMRFTDNVQAQFGDNGDFTIYHDGSNSYLEKINAGTGNVVIQNSNDGADIIFKSDDGSGGTATYMTIDGGLSVTKFSKNTVHSNGVNAYFGSSSVASISHSGSDFTINNTTGNFTIKNSADDKDIIFQSDDGSGGTETFFFLDGSHGGNPITMFPDNSALNFGSTLGDLKISHDGSNSAINNGTGALILRQSVNDGDLLLQCDDGSGGTTAYLTLDGSATNIKVSQNLYVEDGYLLSAGSGLDLRLKHDGTDSLIFNETGDLYIQNKADDKDIIFQSDDGSGGVETYFFLDGNAGGANPTTVFPDNARLAIGSGQDLKLYHSPSINYIEANNELRIRQTKDDADILLQSDDGSGGVTTYIQLDGSDLSTKILTQKLIISNLPTSDPGVSGQVWNNNGVLNISAGG